MFHSVVLDEIGRVLDINSLALKSQPPPLQVKEVKVECAALLSAITRIWTEGIGNCGTC
jgi:hypothetical protein